MIMRSIRPVFEGLIPEKLSTKFKFCLCTHALFKRFVSFWDGSMPLYDGDMALMG